MKQTSILERFYAANETVWQFPVSRPCGRPPQGRAGERAEGKEAEKEKASEGACHLADGYSVSGRALFLPVLHAEQLCQALAHGLHSDGHVHHAPQWMATYLLPESVIDEVLQMRIQAAEAVGDKESSWSKEPETTTPAEPVEPAIKPIDTTVTEMETETMTPEDEQALAKEAFYEMFGPRSGDDGSLRRAEPVSAR